MPPVRVTVNAPGLPDGSEATASLAIIVMVGGTTMGYLGGLHYWWPKMTGRMYPEGWGRVSAVITFLGFNLTFMPQFVMGYLGMPRRYHNYYFMPEVQIYHILSTAGSTALALGFSLPIFYLAWSWIKGPAAGPNPWKAIGLEWNCQSPPIQHNFHETPIVTWEAYDYDNELELLDDLNGNGDENGNGHSPDPHATAARGEA